MDVSPGTKSERVMLRFPGGVPTVADEYMSDWMTYVYNQFPRPVNAVGVEVRIQVVDPNGAYAWIGTATSDAYGNYGYSFVPQMKGTYTIIATFVGSDAYYGTQATAYLIADPAPTQVTIPPYPGYQGPSAQDVANRVLADLPENPTSNEISQAVINQLPDYPEPTVCPQIHNNRHRHHPTSRNSNRYRNSKSTTQKINQSISLPFFGSKPIKEKG